MSFLKNIFGRREYKKKEETHEEFEEEIPEEEYEVSGLTSGIQEDMIIIKPFSLTDIIDVDSIVEEIRKGNLVLINVDPLANRDPRELHRAVTQLRTRIETLGGHVVAIRKSEYMPVLAMPPFIEIWKPPKSSKNQSI